MLELYHIKTSLEESVSIHIQVYVKKTDMFSIHWMTALHYVLNIFNWVNINAILATMTKASIQRFWQILDFLTKDFNGKQVLADQLPTMSSEMYLFFIICSIIWLIKLLFHHLFIFNTGQGL